MLQCRVTSVGHLVKFEFQRSNNSFFFFSISVLLVILELAHNKKKFVVSLKLKYDWVFCIFIC